MALTGRMRLLPKVDQVLGDPGLGDALAQMPRAIVLRAVQTEMETLRQLLLTNGGRAPSDRRSAQEQIIACTRKRLLQLGQPTLRRVLNATGVILHTNLGRAPLGESVVQAVAAAARGYLNLEYDLEQGQRTSRMTHVEELLTTLLGAEAAFAVNNNAAAVLLAIDTLGQEGVVVSRGELVEIGDGFRLPDILARARVPIHEVGTTNRTSPDDYETAASRPGCVLLKVHRSNFAVRGFTREASIAELVGVAERCQARVVYDLGSGGLLPEEAHGLGDEPDVRDAIGSGAGLVTMSGDKLLGGPQAGILAGRRDLVSKVRQNPLGRALRLDKLTLAALQATLLPYLQKEGAQNEIPALGSILARPEEVERRAHEFVRCLGKGVEARFEIQSSQATVGGGSFADVELPSFEVRVHARHVTGNTLLARLRAGEPAVVARIQDDTVGLDLRCITEDEVEPLAQALLQALAVGGVKS